MLSFVNDLMEKNKVMAPVAKGASFIFDELKDAAELRLDYTTTTLPPKKMFFPPKQNLLEFNNGKAKSCLDPQNVIVLGVHPYDIRAIAMTDKLFSDRYPDCNYLANRNAATIIGTHVQNPYKRAFFSSIAQDMALSGHDAFLTKITGGYVFEVLTKKGEALVADMGLEPANEDQAKEAAAVNTKAEASAPEQLPFSAADVKKKVRDSFESDIWDALSKDCFSCGSCNIVCPTCYCFDVQDEWGLGTANGKRYRRWDACLTSEFSQVSVQGGSENFRETRAERYRHRFMRKTAYLNDKLGAPACVGCGRCAGACTADIADPVNTITKIMES
jgi:formate hydrogenlyase subunit 6/NADH:ubiquinone oxidoreductase subunit I